MKNTIIAMDKSGSIRVYLTITTEMVQKAIDIHECLPTSAAALGRTMTIAGIMGIMLKDEESKMTLQIKGDGLAQEILACANAKGEVKAYIANPYVDLPLKEDGHLNIGGAVGKGSLTVIKDLGLKEPYVGRIELVNGEIAEDLTRYFAVSEQQPSSVALGVRIGEDGKVMAAGGLVIQVLPNAKDEAITKIEDVLFFMDALSLLIMDSAKETGKQDVRKLLDLIFDKLPEEYKLEVLDEREISWNCDCSKERMGEALVSIGKKDLKQIIEEDGKAELNCTFCRNKYNFTKEELEDLLLQAK